MKATELKTLIQSTPAAAAGIMSAFSQETKAVRIESIDFIIDLIGDHEIPQTEGDYADLLTEILGDDVSLHDANVQMHHARQVLAAKTIHAR